MRMVIPSYGLEIEFIENRINVLTIENPTAFANILGDLWMQYNGNDGKAVLSDQNTVLKISKETECIFNIYDINCNDKRILTKIYQELNHIAEEDLIKKTAEVNQFIVDYIDELIQRVPYSLTQSLDIDVISLLKLYDLKVVAESESILESVINYIKLISRVLGKSIFIFSDLKHYLNAEETKVLYEFSFYEKIFILIIEGDDIGHLEGEKHIILDKDLCIIDV